MATYVAQCVIGSRSLARIPGARDAAWVALLGLPPYSAFFSGGAVGPDTWGLLVADEAGKPTTTFALDGTLPGGDAFGWGPRWTPANPPPKGTSLEIWRKWCLQRDRVMMAHGAGLVADGWTVRVLALLDPESKTKGTKYSAQEADRLGLPVTVLGWDARGRRFRTWEL